MISELRDTALETEDWRDFGTVNDESEEVQVEEYDITASPNDFNTLTIVNFIESGAVKVPGFQRNYVWDLRRASKLIESLILGLPVPQVFLYEEARNSFLVIDGQQRLMTIFFFVKQRFPRRAKRAELRRMTTDSGQIPDSLLFDDEYFESFNLRLPELSPGQKNRFAKMNYSTLGEYRTQFDLRTIRNIIVKQLKPSGDDSSIYEMFNRLNTGGINLTPQEIRASLYHSPLYEMLNAFNLEERWRALLGTRDPDLNLRDVEILLRGIAMLRNGSRYTSSMAQFLNTFSKEAKTIAAPTIAELQSELEWFVGSLSDSPSPEKLFQGRTGKFSVTLFEAAFAAACSLRSADSEFIVTPAQITALKSDEEFARYAYAQTNLRANVAGRLARARTFLTSDEPRGS